MQAEDIIEKLLTFADKDRSNQSKRFFKTGDGEYAENDIFLGIRVPQLRALVKPYVGLDLSQIAILLQSTYHEARLLALFILNQQFKKAKGDDRTRIYQFYVNGRVATEHHGFTRG